MSEISTFLVPALGGVQLLSLVAFTFLGTELDPVPMSSWMDWRVLGKIGYMYWPRMGVDPLLPVWESSTLTTMPLLLCERQEVEEEEGQIVDWQCENVGALHEFDMNTWLWNARWLACLELVLRLSADKWIETRLSSPLGMLRKFVLSVESLYFILAWSRGKRFVTSVACLGLVFETLSGKVNWKHTFNHICTCKRCHMVLPCWSVESVYSIVFRGMDLFPHRQHLKA